jgi:hypothetical protein
MNADPRISRRSHKQAGLGPIPRRDLRLVVLYDEPVALRYRLRDWALYAIGFVGALLYTLISVWSFLLICWMILRGVMS